MNRFAQLLQPPDTYLRGLEVGTYRLNIPANRVIDAQTGQFVAALVPGEDLSQSLAKLPIDPKAAAQTIQRSAELTKLAPLLNSLQLTSSIGALTSVANLGVSFVGFALVMRRLSRIEGKLDELLGKIEVLQQAVREVHVQMDALSVARVLSAAAALDRALAADSAVARRELAIHARNLFQESRLLYLELWRRANPLFQADVPIVTALEMQGRYTASAIGEIQAEFIAGDLGAFKHAAESAARDLRDAMGFEPVPVFRSRSDQSCGRGMGAVTLFQAGMAQLAKELRDAREAAEWTSQRLEGYAADADLVKALDMEPHQLARGVRTLKGNALFLLPTYLPPSTH